MHEHPDCNLKMGEFMDHKIYPLFFNMLFLSLPNQNPDSGLFSNIRTELYEL